MALLTNTNLSYKSFICSFVTGITFVESGSIPNLSALFFSFSSSNEENEFRMLSEIFLSRLKLTCLKNQKSYCLFLHGWAMIETRLFLFSTLIFLVFIHFSYQNSPRWIRRLLHLPSYQHFPFPFYKWKKVRQL